MEDDSEQVSDDKRPSKLTVVLRVIVLAALVVRGICLLLEGELLMMGGLLLGGIGALLAFEALRRRRNELFAWPVWMKVAATFLGLSGALGMLIQSINLGMMVTYFQEVAWWVPPACMFCLVLTFFLPAVVMLIWLAREGEACADGR